MRAAVALSDQPSRPAEISRAVGFVLVGGVVLFALLAPWLTSASPSKQNLMRVLETPSAAHWLGTDQFGRSMLARLGAATRLSLGLALLCVASAAIPGTLLGMVAAWRSGPIDRTLSATADSVLAVPGLILVLLLSSLAPGAYWPLYLGLSLVLWVEYFRVVRATSSVLLASPQVEASRLLGFGPLYIARRHLLPELAPMLGTLMAYGAATAILSLAALGFVGIGLRPPTAEWGIMMTELLPHYYEAPWLIAQPIVLLALTVLGLALVAGRDPR
jgi:peptide/nickel transport system permease protein